VDASVLVGVPTGEGVAVLLFGANVVGEIGQSAGGMAGEGAGRGAADAGVAGLRAILTQEGVFGAASSARAAVGFSPVVA
jgi:hypothetical protein